MAEVGVYQLGSSLRNPSVYYVHPELHCQCPINIYSSLAVAVLDRKALISLKLPVVPQLAMSK